MSIFSEENQQPIFNIGIDETACAYLLQTARWTKFLAIVGFIVTGLLLIGGLAVGYVIPGVQHYESGASLMIVLGYVLIAVVYLYPTVALLKFTTSIKAALNGADQAYFNEAMRWQRNMFRFMGIMVIAVFVLYGCLIIFFLIPGNYRF